MLFFGLGLTFALRMSFSIVLTQMVYVPNSNVNNETAETNGELVCPIKYPTNQNETTPVRKNNNDRQFSFLIMKL